MLSAAGTCDAHIRQICHNALPAFDMRRKSGITRSFQAHGRPLWQSDRTAHSWQKVRSHDKRRNRQFQPSDSANCWGPRLRCLFLRRRDLASLLARLSEVVRCCDWHYSRPAERCLSYAVVIGLDQSTRSTGTLLVQTQDVRPCLSVF